jgi:3-hydroxyisobutyrate dehydrogenase
MAKLAFLGLGLMGTPMATRLLAAGHDLTVWNRTIARTLPLIDKGARAAASPAEAVAGVDAVITMLATPQALVEVLFGDDGVAGALNSGQWLIDMSTVGPQIIDAVAPRLPSATHLIDAPVRGSIPEATSGRLAIYVGATDDGFVQTRIRGAYLARTGFPRRRG